MSDERPAHAWLNGNCIAMLHDLPPKTMVAYADSHLNDPVRLNDQHTTIANSPVFVVRWADGSTPIHPEAHKPRYYSDTRSRVDDVYCACGWHSAAMSRGEVMEAHRAHLTEMAAAS